MSVKYTSYIPQTSEKITKELVNRMFKAGLIIQEETEKNLQGEGSSDKTYLVPGTKDTYYTPSEPGEPPAVATGRLLESIDTKVIRDKIGTSYQVGSPLKKAIWLEKGTKLMKPRPFLKPSYKAKKQEIKKLFSKKIE